MGGERHGQCGWLCAGCLIACLCVCLCCLLFVFWLLLLLVVLVAYRGRVGPYGAPGQSSGRVCDKLLPSSSNMAKSGTSKSGQVCCAAEAKIMEAGIMFAMATSRASCAAGRQSIQDCSTSSESSQHGASGHRSRIQACAQQSCAKSGNVLCCAGEGLCHAGNLPSTRNRCLRRQAC